MSIGASTLCTAALFLAHMEISFPLVASISTPSGLSHFVSCKAGRNDRASTMSQTHQRKVIVKENARVGIRDFFPVYTFGFTFLGHEVMIMCSLDAVDIYNFCKRHTSRRIRSSSGSSHVVSLEATKQIRVDKL